MHILYHDMCEITHTATKRDKLTCTYKIQEKNLYLINIKVLLDFHQSAKESKDHAAKFSPNTAGLQAYFIYLFILSNICSING